MFHLGSRRLCNRDDDGDFYFGTQNRPAAATFGAEVRHHTGCSGRESGRRLRIQRIPHTVGRSAKKKEIKAVIPDQQHFYCFFPNQSVVVVVVGAAAAATDLSLCVRMNGAARAPSDVHQPEETHFQS